jgi:flavin reductase (DIM6/NTAB) family NADH-FMN oxidoreductase RutF
MDQAPVSTADFVQAMGQHVSSVCVITTLHEGIRYGLTATAVSSLTADPPRLLVCVNKSGVTHEKILAAQCFCVNVLEEHQEPVAKAFAGMMGKDFDRFSTGAWRSMATGAPALDGAAAVFDCRMATTLDQSTHTVFIGEAVAVALRPGHDTLLYGARRFRTLRKVVAAPAKGDMDTLSF